MQTCSWIQLRLWLRYQCSHFDHCQCQIYALPTHILTPTHTHTRTRTPTSAETNCSFRVWLRQMEYLIKTCADKGCLPSNPFPPSPLPSGGNCNQVRQVPSPGAGGKRSICNLWLAPARAFNKTAAAFESQRHLHMIRVF